MFVEKRNCGNWEFFSCGLVTFLGYLFVLFQVHDCTFLFQTIGLRIVDDMLNKSFYRLGLVVGRRPGYFLVVPVLLTMFFVTGFQRIKTNIDPEYLFSPVNGDGKYERAVVEELFKMNYSTQFNVARITRAGGCKL